MPSPIRVRFAPSPTGYLHVGSLRTALYNYLFARRHQGAFLLRIEDTDRTRYVPGAVEKLIDSLHWSGLDWDEGPDKGGPCGSYFQSERTPLYRDAAARLLEAGHAYRCFCTPERLDAMRKERHALKLDEKYDRACLRLSPAEVEAKVAAGTHFVVRLLIPAGETLRVEDLVRGEVEFQSDLVDDQVLLKSDGFPTYHLAVVVDDHAMGITHVIRGEEWLSSMPKHLLLYRYLGYQPPVHAHLPLLLNPDRSKLSKRQGDVAVEDYRDHGYFPEALINFVAFLGWNPGDDREIFSLDDLIAAFSLDRVNKAGAIFNTEKLRWFNEQYLKHRPGPQLLAELRALPDASKFAGCPDDFLLRVIDLMRERVTFVSEIPVKAGWFFEDPSAYEEATVRKRWKPESGPLLRELLPDLQSLPAFDHPSLEASVRGFAESRGLKLGDLVHPLRLACTGVGGGPGLFELMETLGKEACVGRIGRAVEVLG